MTEAVEIIVGTYEEFVLGYKVVYDKMKNYSLVMNFANHSHHASIRCVATEGHFLASGGADEDIHLYDLKTRKESGVLGYHNGTVNCMEFTPNSSHLMSGCENGSIIVCRTGSWQVEKLWATHKGSAVTSMSVHPSGKLALSVGKDGRLRTWNLVKGRQAYATRLCRDKFQQLTCVKWSPSGDKYAVVLDFNVLVYDMDTAGVIYTVKSTKKPSCICFISDEILYVGDEEGMLTIHSLPQQLLLKEVKVHQGRVKCLDRIDTWLVSASSNGVIKLWTLQDETTLSEACSAKTGCRITCLVLVSGKFSIPIKEETVKAEEPPVKSIKRKAGIVVQLSEGESSQVKKQSNMKSSRKNKTQKKQKSGVTTVLDSSGQKWTVEDI